MEQWEPIQRRDPVAGVPMDGGRKPSIEGRDSLAWAMAELVPKHKPPKRKRWWQKWLAWCFKHPKRVALFLLADLIVGSIGWHYLFRPNPAAAKRAVVTTISDAAREDWAGVYNSLCADDRAQIAESDLASQGQAALVQNGGLSRWTTTSARTVNESLGPINLPAVQVSGEAYSTAGQPSPYQVVVVHEATGWHVCLSAGGFSVLGYTSPLTGGFTP